MSILLKRKYPITLLLSLFLVFLATATFANGEEKQTLPTFLEKVRENASHVQSFSCNFTQKRELSLFPEPVIFTGNLKLIRPDRLRWAFTAPIPSVLIFNGKKGLRCNENQEVNHFDLETDPIMKVVAEQLWSWLNNDYGKLEKQYSIEIASERSLRITPAERSTSEFIKSITITFDSTNSHPKLVVIDETGGDSTRIEFSEYVLNPPLPQSTFTRCYQSE